MSSQKPSVLLMGQTPPPWHGQAVATQILFDHDWPNHDVHRLRMEFSEEMLEVGRFQWKKLRHLVQLIGKARQILSAHPDSVLLYPPASAKWIPFLRDVIFLTAVRHLAGSTVFIFHASGLPVFVGRGLVRRTLGRLAYHGAEVALEVAQEAVTPHEVFAAKSWQWCPCGIEVSDSGKPSRRGSACFQVLFVGSLQEGKGVLEVIKTARVLKDRGLGRNFLIRIVGRWFSKEFEQETRALRAALEVQEMVELVGELTGDDKWQAYADAEVFFFPTHYASEATPIVLMEALGMGLPLVSTTWAGIPAMLEGCETAALLPVRSPERFAEALHTLFLDRETSGEIGNASKAFYRENFLPAKFIERVEKAFDQAIRQKDAGRNVGNRKLEIDLGTSNIELPTSNIEGRAVAAPPQDAGETPTLPSFPNNQSQITHNPFPTSSISVPSRSFAVQLSDPAAEENDKSVVAPHSSPIPDPRSTIPSSSSPNNQSQITNNSSSDLRPSTSRPSDSPSPSSISVPSRSSAVQPSDPAAEENDKSVVAPHSSPIPDRRSTIPSSSSDSNPQSLLKISAYLADQNPGHDRSFGISRMSQVVLGSLQTTGAVEIEAITSRTSQQAPESVATTRVLPWGTRTKWVRLLTDHFHPLFGRFRTSADIHYFPKGYLPLLSVYCRPSVVTIHDTIIQYDEDHYPRWRKRREYAYWAMMLKHTLKHADRILTVSKSSKKQIEAFMDRHGISRKPITVTYEPCWYEGIPQPERPAKENYVVHLASVEPHKRTAHLIRWWHEAEFQGRSLPMLHLIGSVPPEVAPLLASSHSIVKRPFLEDSALQAAYAAARALILPSEIEGFGLPALEAYYLGTPVCFVKGTSVEEILSVATTKGGFALDQPETLFAALAEVMRIPPGEIRECGLKLRETYAAAKVAERMVKVFEEVGKR